MELNQITIPVQHVERSMAFYEGMGFKVIVRALPHYARFECADGGATFSLHQSDHRNSGDGIWIYFEEEQLDDKVAQLMQKGYVFDELPNDKPWLWREARLKDLDGNQLIIYWGGVHRRNPPWRVGSESES